MLGAPLRLFKLRMQILLSVIIVTAICWQDNLIVSSAPRTCCFRMNKRTQENVNKRDGSRDRGWIRPLCAQQRCIIAGIWSRCVVHPTQTSQQDEMSLFPEEESVKHCECAQGCFSMCNFESKDVKAADVHQGCLIGWCRNRNAESQERKKLFCRNPSLLCLTQIFLKIYITPANTTCSPILSTLSSVASPQSLRDIRNCNSIRSKPKRKRLFYHCWMAVRVLPAWILFSILI